MLGFSSAGKVVEVGEGVENVNVNDHVSPIALSFFVELTCEIGCCFHIRSIEGQSYTAIYRCPLDFGREGR